MAVAGRWGVKRDGEVCLRHVLFGAGRCGVKRDGEVCLRHVLLGAGRGRVGW